MNEIQAKNTLDWIEALLSDKYKHSSVELYDPAKNTWGAVGVALEINHMPLQMPAEGYLSGYGLQFWFNEHFGLPKSAAVYGIINTYSKNFLAVAALLLDAVPIHSGYIRRRKAGLDWLIREKANAKIAAE